MLSVADANMLISSEKEGLSLTAPDYGIDKIYYDGHRLEVFFTLLLFSVGLFLEENQLSAAFLYFHKDSGCFLDGWKNMWYLWKI